MFNKVLKVLTLLCIVLMLTFILDEKAYLNAREVAYSAAKAVVSIQEDKLVSNFQIYETTHFKIKYKPDDELLIPMIAEQFERSWRLLGKGEAKTLVFVYPNENEFWGYQKSVSGQSVMGAYRMGVIHVLSPNAYEMDAGEKVAYFKKYGPVLHEFTHKVIDDKTGGNVELWLTEGLALYEEYEKNGTEWAPGFQYNQYYKPEALREDFIHLEDIQAYRQSYDSVKRLIDQYGMEKMDKLLDELGSGYSMDEAFRNVYSMELNVFLAKK